MGVLQLSSSVADDLIVRVVAIEILNSHRMSVSCVEFVYVVLS